MKFAIIPLFFVLLLTLSVSLAYGESTNKNIGTVPVDGGGTYEFFVKICAGEHRLEQPTISVSSDSESYRTQSYVNLPPGFCGNQSYTISAKDPKSIIVKVEGDAAPKDNLYYYRYQNSL